MLRPADSEISLGVSDLKRKQLKYLDKTLELKITSVKDAMYYGTSL